MTVGDRIKSIREEKKITQEELAKQIDSTKQTIYKYENGIITNIPSDKIEKIAEFLGVTPAYLMGWDTGINTIATTHNDGDEWTEEELEAIEDFKQFVLSKRDKK